MVLDRKSLRQCAGDVIICGFAGPRLDSGLREVLAEIGPLGLIAFRRNLEGARGALELNRELKAHEPSLLLSIDQEGGRVARLHEGVTVWPPMAAIGHHGDPELATAVGGAIGLEMRLLGFDLNFAPVLDVHTNPKNPIIGDRALAGEPSQVAELGAAMVRGMQAAGVAACGKHFPGHGDTSVDSHLALPIVEHDRARFVATEWPPFVAASKAGVAAIMTAHIRCTGLDEEVPATLSPTILTKHLRGHCGFQGAIISDDIDMRALADHAPPAELGPLGLAAGVDVFLACKDEAAMLELYAGIVRAAESKRLPHATLEARAKQARALRAQYHRPVESWAVVGPKLAACRPRHQQWAERLAANYTVARLT